MDGVFGKSRSATPLDSRKPGWQNAPMKTFLLRFFTWWNGQTFGTQLWTWRYGELVGEDEFGNRYFRTRGGKIDPTLLMQRRWVIYNGIAEPSMVPPSWHGWLHHTVDTPPTEENYKPRAVAEAAPAESHRHAGGASPDRLDACRRAAGRRRPAITRPGRRADSFCRLQPLSAALSTP